MKVLIVANGNFSTSEVIKYCKKGYYLVVCDGAADKLRNTEVMFDFVVGDMDSITQETLQLVQSHHKYFHKKTQDDTDLEFAVKITQEFAHEIVILGAVYGSRFDHMLYNILLLKKYHNPNIPMLVANETQYMMLIKDQNVKIESEIGSNISFIGFPEAIVTCKPNNGTEALKWELHKYKLDFAKSSSTSNLITSSSINIFVQGDCILTFPCNAKYYIL